VPLASIHMLMVAVGADALTVCSDETACVAAPAVVASIVPARAATAAVARTTRQGRRKRRDATVRSQRDINTPFSSSARARYLYRKLSSHECDVKYYEMTIHFPPRGIKEPRQCRGCFVGAASLKKQG
jgi:hypothetical protein